MSFLDNVRNLFLEFNLLFENSRTSYEDGSRSGIEFYKLAVCLLAKMYRCDCNLSYSRDALLTGILSAVTGGVHHYITLD